MLLPLLQDCFTTLRPGLLLGSPGIPSGVSASNEASKQPVKVVDQGAHGKAEREKKNSPVGRRLSRPPCRNSLPISRNRPLKIHSGRSCLERFENRVQRLHSHVILLVVRFQILRRTLSIASSAAERVLVRPSLPHSLRFSATAKAKAPTVAQNNPF